MRIARLKFSSPNRWMLRYGGHTGIRSNVRVWSWSSAAGARSPASAAKARSASEAAGKRPDSSPANAVARGGPSSSHRRSSSLAINGSAARDAGIRACMA